MPTERRTIGGTRVVFRVFDLNLGVFRRLGSSVKIRGGRRNRGDVTLVNTYFGRVDGVELDIATRQKECRDTKGCVQAEVSVGLSATIDTGGGVDPGGAPPSSVDGVKAAAVVTVNGRTERFTGRA